MWEYRNIMFGRLERTREDIEKFSHYIQTHGVMIPVVDFMRWRHTVTVLIYYLVGHLTMNWSSYLSIDAEHVLLRATSALPAPAGTTTTEEKLRNM